MSVFINMNDSNFNMDLMDRMIKKFMSAMGMKIKIEDTNYSDYKYFNHSKYGVTRTISYIVKVIDKKNNVIYRISVYWHVINGKLRSDYSVDYAPNPFEYLGIDYVSVDKYLVEKTRGMAEEWIKTFPERI